MFEILFWIYLVNSMLIIIHEMDSVYWKEWAACFYAVFQKMTMRSTGYMFGGTYFLITG